MMLAFVAALDGPSSDLYVFHVSSFATTRLTNDLAQAMDPEWSQDSRYVLYRAVDDINIGRSGTHMVAGLWAASVQGSNLRLLEPGDASVVGWVSPNDVLIDHFEMGCDTYDLDLLDLRSGIPSTIWRGSFVSAAANSDGSVVLLGSPYEEVEDDLFEWLCPTLYPPGLYVIRLPGGRPERIGQFDWGGPYPFVQWVPRLNRFLVVEGSDVSLRTSQGDASPEQVPPWSNPVFSPSDQLWISNAGPTLQFFNMEGDLVGVIRGSFCAHGWTPDGGAVYFSDDENLYFAATPDYEAVLALSGMTGLCGSEMVWVGS
jgi:hypothetical protein